MLEVSFELFPPKTEGGIEKLKEVCTALNTFQPSYYSVTFGAAGSTQERTTETILQLQQNSLSTAPHISCIGMKKSTLRSLLALYQSHHIRRLVVLRGDQPDNIPILPSDFHYAHELVKFIRDETGQHFYIEVAAYPEFHPQTQHPLADIENLKRKIDAGANGAITQYFFNIDAYEQFMEMCATAHIRAPITPGIMPIFNFEKLIRFSALCGAEIPLWLRKRLNIYQDDQDSMVKMGIEIVTRLCEKLIQSNVPGLHFYTLNQVHPTDEIVKRTIEFHSKAC